MSDFDYRVNTTTNGGLFSHGTFETAGIENAVPAKAIPVKKLTQQDQILETCRGVAEVYHTVDTAKLEAYATAREDPSFLNGLETKQQHLRDDEIVFTFFAYTDTHDISAAEARSLVELVDEYSDVITLPLQPQLLRAIRGKEELDEECDDGPFPVYRRGVERFLEAAADLDSEKPVMGIVPLLSDGQMNELLTLYEDFDVDMIGVNLEGNTLLNERNNVKLRQLVGRMSALRVFESYLLYALNPGFPQYRQGKTVRLAEDFTPVGMGFDIVGGNHVGLGFEPDGERSNFNVYDVDVAGYKPVSVDSIVEEWPVSASSGIPPERLEELSTQRAGNLVSLIGAEQLQRSFDELRNRIDQGNEMNFLRSKEGLTEKVRDKFGATAGAYENGASPPVDSY